MVLSLTSGDYVSDVFMRDHCGVNHEQPILGLNVATGAFVLLCSIQEESFHRRRRSSADYAVSGT